MNDFAHIEIITICVTVVPWLVFLTAWFVRIQMKVKTVEEAHRECRSFRSVQESNIIVKLDAMQNSLTRVENDVKWLKEDREPRVDK
jgi:hypothetical protein